MTRMGPAKEPIRYSRRRNQGGAGQLKCRSFDLDSALLHRKHTIESLIELRAPVDMSLSVGCDRPQDNSVDIMSDCPSRRDLPIVDKDRPRRTQPECQG